MRQFFFALMLSTIALAAPDPRKPAPLDDAADIAEKLTERIDLDRIDNVSIRVALDVLQEKIGYSIVLDYRGFGRTDDPDSRRGFDDRQVSLHTMKRVRIETVLRQMLDQVDADFLIAPDHVFVTTPAIKAVACGPIRTLRNLDPRAPRQDAENDNTFQIRHTSYITMRFQDTPISEALRAVAKRSGQTITIAADAADKGRTPINLTLTNAPLETAVSNLAEAAGLRAFRHGAAIVVVSESRGKGIDSVSESHFAACCTLGNGRNISLEEMESIAKLFAGARPVDGTTSKVNSLAKDSELKQIEISHLKGDKDLLEEKVRNIIEELERLKKK